MKRTVFPLKETKVTFMVWDFGGQVIDLLNDLEESVDRFFNGVCTGRVLCDSSVFPFSAVSLSGCVEHGRWLGWY